MPMNNTLIAEKWLNDTNSLKFLASSVQYK